MSKLQQAQYNQGHSKHFFDYIRAVGEAKSKQEEDKIVTKDVALLKHTLSDRNPDKKFLKENVVRVFYAEMLGHSCEFGHITAVNLASNPDLLAKRVGYLATWLTVNPEHEFMYLIVASIQRDMKSANFLEIAAALTAASKLIRQELMTCISADVSALMTHTHPLVRKKAVAVMHAFFRKSDGAVGDTKQFRLALCDRDPAVMSMSLSLLFDVCLQDPAANKDLVPSFLSILKQIMEHRLSREYDYHRVPAPWMQIKLLKLIALLCADDKTLSDRAGEVLGEVMKRADTGLNIGHAVMFECIKTITSIVPIPDLIETAAESISKMLTSTSSNLKYLGITALSRIVKIDPKYAQEHQAIVIGCLEDSDDAIRRKTLELLFAMCNEDNVEPIVGRILKFLAGSTESFLRAYLVKNICNVVDLYSPTNEWYIQSLNRTIELAPEHVTSTTVQGMLKVIAEGYGEDEAEDAHFRMTCVENYYQLAENTDTKRIPAILYQIIAWVIGEYGFLTKKISRAMLLDRMCDMAERAEDASTKQWIVTAMMKLVAFNNALPDNVEEVVVKLQQSRNVALQQRCTEFLALAKVLPYLKKVQPLDGCCEDVEVDAGLGFLDSIVEEALARGARPYQKKEVRLGADTASSALKTDAYKSQQANVVDEGDLTRDKFEQEEEEKLIIKDGARKWGAKNLEGEAAVDHPPAGSIIEEPAAGAAGGAAAEGGESHVDPLAGMDISRRPTKTEKFVADIFGGSKSTSRRRGAKAGAGADRAREAQRRFEEAEAAERAEAAAGGGAEEDSAAAGPSVPSRVPAVAAAAGPTPPAAAPSGAIKFDFNFQKQLTADALMVRVGIMTSQDVAGLAVQLTPPPVCTAEIVEPAGIPGLQVTIPGARAGVPIFMVIKIQASNYPSGGGLVVQVTTPLGSGQGGFPLALTDLLRPTPLTTELFGSQWVALNGAAGNEVKVSLVFPKALTPELLQQFLAAGAGVKIIQVIGRECIAATMVANCGKVVLLHMVVDGASIHLTVRCPVKEFGEIIARTLHAGVPKA